MGPERLVTANHGACHDALVEQASDHCAVRPHPSRLTSALVHRTSATQLELPRAISKGAPRGP
jgi:hypothetical protein